MGVFGGEITLAVPDSLLHSLETFGIEPGMGAAMALEDGGDYDYQGHCPRTGQLYTLPRTALAKAVAQGLMAQLSQTTQPEGKMYGVLLVQAPAGPIAGPIGVLKAFSGLWRGQERVPGWVPPMPGRERVARQEAQTLDQLAALKDQLVALQQRPERQTYARWQEDWAKERQALNQRHRDRKQGRDRQRQTLTGAALTSALATLEQESRGDKAELRQFKQRQHQALAPLVAAIQAADAEAVALKRQRRDLSRQLQADMQAAYTLTNFAGAALSLQALAPQGGLPTGTGDCCAPKLLHTAAQYGLKPLALAEFWWGPAQGDRHPGTFYGACVERCQPILGFLLSGLSARVLGGAGGGWAGGERRLPCRFCIKTPGSWWWISRRGCCRYRGGTAIAKTVCSPACARVYRREGLYNRCTGLIKTPLGCWCWRWMPRAIAASASSLSSARCRNATPRFCRGRWNNRQA